VRTCCGSQTRAPERASVRRSTPQRPERRTRDEGTTPHVARLLRAKAGRTEQRAAPTNVNQSSGSVSENETLYFITETFSNSRTAYLSASSTSEQMMMPSTFWPGRAMFSRTQPM